MNSSAGGLLLSLEEREADTTVEKDIHKVSFLSSPLAFSQTAEPREEAKSSPLPHYHDYTPRIVPSPPSNILSIRRAIPSLSAPTLRRVGPLLTPPFDRT